jgi:Tfp pilus assembly protein PilW
MGISLIELLIQHNQGKLRVVMGTSLIELLIQHNQGSCVL